MGLGLGLGRGRGAGLGQGQGLGLGPGLGLGQGYPPVHRLIHSPELQQLEDLLSFLLDLLFIRQAAVADHLCALGAPDQLVSLLAKESVQVRSLCISIIGQLLVTKKAKTAINIHVPWGFTHIMHPLTRFPLCLKTYVTLRHVLLGTVPPQGPPESDTAFEALPWRHNARFRVPCVAPAMLTLAYHNGDAGMTENVLRDLAACTETAEVL